MLAVVDSEKPKREVNSFQITKSLVCILKLVNVTKITE